MIPLFRPSLGEEELNSIKKTFESGWVGLGPRTKEFEDAFARYIGTKHAVGVASATDGLHIILKSFGVEGSEVLTPSLTFISTNHAILYNNAKPVFVDVEEDTLCVDVGDLNEKVTSKTKAIIPVHYGGHPVDMNAINEIAEDHNLVVIEDAAHAVGAEYNGKKTGTLGDAGSFSFQAIKNMTTGEGGMLTFDDDALDKRLRALRWVGINKDTVSRAMSQGKETRYSWEYDVVELGYKCHMSDIQAAIGLIQLKKLDNHLNAGRTRVAEAYNKAFRDVEWISIPVEKPGVKRVYWNYALKVENGKRDEFGEYLREHGISYGVHYLPNHLHPFYQELINNGTIKEPHVPVTMEVWKKILCLPIYADLKAEEVNYIIETVKRFEG
ncbi:MAG: DegT/DnrJ/EryC1/StrS family aminotransferase [Thermoplasmata archaeon]|nr:DegT/DnrJ/EryC1/StrS family aminotransferase [Thermoplasmata archaeon]